MTQHKKILWAGFGRLGKRSLEQLCAQGHPQDQLWALNRSGEPSAYYQSLQGDLTAPASLKGLPKVDIVIYSATPTEYTVAGYHAAYLTGLDNLLQAYFEQHRHIPHIIYISSTRVYPQQQGEIIDETSLAYAQEGKSQALLSAEWLAMARDPSATIIRFGGIYMSSKRPRLLANEAPLLELNDLSPWTNRIHREDAASIVSWLITKYPQDNTAGIWLGVDPHPTRKHQVQYHLAEQFAQTHRVVNVHQAGLPQGKRAFPKRLLEAGFTWQYPSFREGYQAL